MKQTYELFLQAGGREWFVPLTCSPIDLMSVARRALADEGAETGDVRQFGQPLFSLAASGSD